MEFLRYNGYALSALSLALLLGFASRAVPTISAIHFVVIAAILIAFTVGAVGSATGAPYYHRRAVYAGFAVRAFMAILAYCVVMGVGMWLFIDLEVY